MARKSAAGGTTARPSPDPAVRKRLLQNVNRRIIHEAVKAEPGINRSQLARRTGLTYGVLEFHISRLERGGVLVRLDSDDGRENLVFRVEDAWMGEDPTTRVLFGGGSTRNIAVCILNKPGISTVQLSEALETHITTIHYHLRKLRKLGLIELAQEVEGVGYEPSAVLHAWADRVPRRLLESPCSDE